MDARTALALEQPFDFLFAEVLRNIDGERHHQARIFRFRSIDEVRINGGRAVPDHRLAAAAAMQSCGAREEQLQVVVQLGHRADRGARGPYRVGLVDGDRRRESFYRGRYEEHTAELQSTSKL